MPVEAAIGLAEAVAKLHSMGVEVALISERQNGLIDVVRNTLVKRFLNETLADKLLFIDSDIVPNAEDILRILALSSKYQVIGATYPIKRDEPIGFFVQLKNGPIKLNDDGLLECKGFGAGFLVIDRSVFDLVGLSTEKYRMDGIFTRFFKTDVVDGEYRGEDIYFLRRWYDEFNGTVVLDPCINLKHVGKKYYDYKFSDWLKSQNIEEK